MEVTFAEVLMLTASPPSQSTSGIHMLCPPAFKRLVVSQYFDAMTHDPAFIGAVGHKGLQRLLDPLDSNFAVL